MRVAYPFVPYAYGTATSVRIPHPRMYIVRRISQRFPLYPWESHELFLASSLHHFPGVFGREMNFSRPNATNEPSVSNRKKEKRDKELRRAYLPERKGFFSPIHLFTSLPPT